MRKLEIRKATADDAAEVSAVMSAAITQLRRVYRPTPEAIQRARAATNCERLVAMLDGKIVGVLRYAVEAERLHLGLGVSPEHQRKGVARALMDSLAAEAASMGCSKLSLYTVKETGNVTVFSRLGFRVVSEEPAKEIESVTGDRLTDVYMERTL